MFQLLTWPDAAGGDLRSGLRYAEVVEDEKLGDGAMPDHVGGDADSWSGHPGIVHVAVAEGATSAIADSAGGYAALTLFDEDCDVLTVEYKINLLAPAAGDYLEAIGTVLNPGRTLTVCQLEVYGVWKGGERKFVANGQQTSIRVNRPAQ